MENTNKNNTNIYYGKWLSDNPEYHKKWYSKNKNKHLKNMRVVIKCECGKAIRKYGYNKHIQSNKHKNLIIKKNNI